MILPQLLPNLREETVSLDISWASATVTTKEVWQLPVSDSFISMVRALSLKGTNPTFPLLLSWLMTLPSAERLVFIFLASVALKLSTFDFRIRSDPARSTNINLLVLWLLPCLTTYLRVTKQWDLEDLSLRA